MGNRTLAIIKPDAIQNGYLGKIINRIVEADFSIIGARLVKMTKQRAEDFYAVHRGKPFFEELTTFMSSGECMVLALEKESAVEAWRQVIGATNPAEAEAGTIRKDFATNLSRNAVHGADNDENATREIRFFFDEDELINRA
ncbi:MAG: nucleoside-diphosphate kinase [Fidelibacterota bacterium]